jgi:SAM-dependent methyltransferase
MISDSWESAHSYDFFMGRWSRLVAHEFLSWLDAEPRLDWLDLGCGTGALTAAILDRANPSSIVACDPSAQLLGFARQQIRDRRVEFTVAAASEIAIGSSKPYVCVSGLALNFIEDPKASLEAIASQLPRNRVVAAYVWDYAEGMELLRVFWDEASALDPRAVALDEGRRFPLCAPDPLRSLFQGVGLKDVDLAPLQISASFEHFSDYWTPFLGATGPAPTYVQSLPLETRRQLANALRVRLSPHGDTGFVMAAKAWAVRGST